MPWTSHSVTATSAIMSGLPRSSAVITRPGRNSVTSVGGSSRKATTSGPTPTAAAAAVASRSHARSMPEQARVLARQAHDDVAAAEAHAQVVVGDAAAERLRGRLGLAEQLQEAGGQGRGGGLRGRAHVIIRTTARDALARARAAWRQQGPGRVIARTYPTAASAWSAERTGEGIFELRAP